MFSRTEGPRCASQRALTRVQTRILLLGVSRRARYRVYLAQSNFPLRERRAVTPNRPERGSQRGNPRWDIWVGKQQRHQKGCRAGNRSDRYDETVTNYARSACNLLTSAVRTQVEHALCAAQDNLSPPPSPTYHLGGSAKRHELLNRVRSPQVREKPSRQEPW